MNDTQPSPARRRCLLIGSVALNIFLIAFVLGRFSAPGMMMPPFAGMMPPGMPPMMGGPHGMPGRGVPFPPPPFIGLNDIFNEDEMREVFTKIGETFAQLQVIRSDFAKQVEAGPVSKEEALANFSRIDEAMMNVKESFQQKAAEKISQMTPEQRKRFAEKLASKEPPRFDR